MAPLCVFALYVVERTRSMKRVKRGARCGGKQRRSANVARAADSALAQSGGAGINAIGLRKTFPAAAGASAAAKAATRCAALLRRRGSGNDSGSQGDDEGGRHIAVDDLTFSVAPGEVFCLLGPNGAGKTTTMRMLTRMMVPEEGSVVLGGRNLDVPAELRDVYSFTGFCPQVCFYLPLHFKRILLTILTCPPHILTFKKCAHSSTPCGRSSRHGSIWRCTVHSNRRALRVSASS